MSSPRFEKQTQGTTIEEADGRDREVASEEAVYDPGPSFVESEPALRLAEMPAWLQTFAASNHIMEDADEVTPQPEEDVRQLEAQEQVADGGNDTGEQEHVENTQPDEAAVTVSEERTQFETVSTTSVMDQAPDDDHSIDDLISEDDLPEWLRSVSIGSAATAGAGVIASRAGADTLSETDGATYVPTVSQAWVTQESHGDLDDRGSTFAHVAQVANQPAVAEVPTGANGVNGESAPTSTPIETESDLVMPTEQHSELPELPSAELEIPAGRRMVPLLVGILFVITLLLIVWLFVS